MGAPNVVTGNHVVETSPGHSQMPFTDYEAVNLTEKMKAHSRGTTGTQ